MTCPCGSPKSFDQCCGPLLDGSRKPETAEALMRSRYVAFTKADIAYIEKTIAPESLEGFDAKDMEASAKKVQWKELQILSTKEGGARDTKGVVEFKAVYLHEGQRIEHHETSIFRKDDSGQWLFVDGEVRPPGGGTVERAEPKIGRNDPCSCGSGKKYKKCCAAA
jgi:SEC-C motif-containing protein